MRQDERIPTYEETYNSLMKLSQIVGSALMSLGKIAGKNELGSEEELRSLVLNASKKLLEQLPIHQLESNLVESMDSKYGHLLDTLKDPHAYQNNDFEVTG